MLSPQLLRFVLPFAALLAACGTINNGTRQRVRFESNPPGATVHVDGQRVTTALEQLLCPGFALIPYAMSPEHHTVVTPGELELPRRNAYDVRFEKDGFEPLATTIRRTGSPEVAGNVFTFLVPGFWVDVASGGAYDLKPEVQYAPLSVRARSRSSWLLRASRSAAVPTA